MNTTNDVKNENVIKSEDRKLKFSEKLAVAITAAPTTFHSQVMQMFLLFFYTDVMKISAGFVAILFLVVRIFDAIAAPLFGVLVDRITTPWGKYRPWFLITGLPYAFFGWLTFTCFNLSPVSKMIYAAVTYTFYSVMGVVRQGPGAAIMPAVTKRVDERVSISQISYFGIMIGAILASVAVQPLYKTLGGGNNAKGFSLLMLGAAVVTILISIFQVLNIKERYVVEVKKDEKRPSFVQMFAAVFTNKTAVICYIYILATNLAQGLRSAVTMYYYKYYFHNEGLVVLVGAISMLPTLIGVIVSAKVTKRLGIKKNLMISVIANVLTMAAIIVVPPTQKGVTIYLGLTVLAGLFTGMATPAQGTMLPAAMDYTEWKSGLNINAFMGSLQGFVQQLAVALSSAAAAASLSLIGYVPGVEQSSSTIFGFKLLMSVIPAVITIFTISIVMFDLTEEKQALITKELAERRKNAEEKAIA